jgi:hypothetical protein
MRSGRKRQCRILASRLHTRNLCALGKPTSPLSEKVFINQLEIRNIFVEIGYRYHLFSCKRGDVLIRRFFGVRSCLAMHSDSVIIGQKHISSFQRSCVPSLVSAHHCSSIVDLWPCHTSRSVGSRSYAVENQCSTACLKYGPDALSSAIPIQRMPRACCAPMKSRANQTRIQLGTQPKLYVYTAVTHVRLFQF